MESLYLMIMGGTSLFFVFWHSVLLLVEVYQKPRTSDSRKFSYRRVCNCGALTLIVETIIISCLLIVAFWNSGDHVTVLQWIVVGFLTVKYVMIVYCVVELCVDSRDSLRHICRGEPDQWATVLKVYHSNRMSLKVIFSHFIRPCLWTVSFEWRPLFILIMHSKYLYRHFIYTRF